MARRLGFGLLGAGFGFGLGFGLGLATTTRADKLISVAPTVKTALFEVERRLTQFHRPNSKCQEEQDEAVIRCAHGRSTSYDTLKREQRRDDKSGYENDGFMVEQAADDDEEDYDEEEAEGDEENDEDGGSEHATA